MNNRASPDYKLFECSIVGDVGSPTLMLVLSYILSEPLLHIIVNLRRTWLAFNADIEI